MGLPGVILPLEVESFHPTLGPLRRSRFCHRGGFRLRILGKRMANQQDMTGGCFQKNPWWIHWLHPPLLGGSSQDLDTWLRTPIYKLFRPFERRNNPTYGTYQDTSGRYAAINLLFFSKVSPGKRQPIILWVLRVKRTQIHPKFPSTIHILSTWKFKLSVLRRPEVKKNSHFHQCPFFSSTLGLLGVR